MRGAGIADELLTSSIQYIINVAMTLPAILYLDKFGRRPALLIGSFLMMTWLFITGALQASYGISNPDKTDKDISWVIPKATCGRLEGYCRLLLPFRCFFRHYLGSNQLDVSERDLSCESSCQGCLSCDW